MLHLPPIVTLLEKTQGSQLLFHFTVSGEQNLPDATNINLPEFIDFIDCPVDFSRVVEL